MCLPTYLIQSLGTLGTGTGCQAAQGPMSSRDKLTQHELLGAAQQAHVKHACIQQLDVVKDVIIVIL